MVLTIAVEMQTGADKNVYEEKDETENQDPMPMIFVH
jgi:hypothetical protein